MTTPEPNTAGFNGLYNYIANPMLVIKESLDRNNELTALMQKKIENLEKEVAELRAEIDGMPGGKLEQEGAERYKRHTAGF